MPVSGTCGGRTRPAWESGYAEDMGWWIALVLAAEPRDPPPVVDIDVRWSAPAQCPDRQTFVDAIAQLVGRELRVRDDAGLAVEAEVRGDGDALVLDLRLRRPEGEEARILGPAACDALVAAGSVVVATRLLETPSARPHVDLPPPPTTTDAEVPASTPPRPTVEATAGPGRATRPTPTRARPRRPQIVLGALAGLGLGLGPRATAELRGDLGVRWPNARALVFARHGFAQTSVDRPAIRMAILGGGVLGCWAPTRGRFDLPLCSGIELAAVIANADGTAIAPHRVTQLWLGVPLEAGFAFAPIPRVALRAAVGTSISIRRPAAHLQGPAGPVTTVRTGVAGLHALAGAELRF